MATDDRATPLPPPVKGEGWHLLAYSDDKLIVVRAGIRPGQSVIMVHKPVEDTGPRPATIDYDGRQWSRLAWFPLTDYEVAHLASFYGLGVHRIRPVVSRGLQRLVIVFTIAALAIAGAIWYVATQL